jgi:O-antigen/teichoic acid export membrane protein
MPSIDAPEVLEPPVVAGSFARESLRIRAARGTLITAAFMVVLQGLGLLKGFVIAAFLSRSDYGLWGVIVITVATLTWLKEVGIGDKYVQQDERDQELAYQKAFTIDLLSNIALMALIAATLPLFALAYGQWKIVVPGLVLASTLVASSLKTPTWIYYRQMRYGRQRTLEAVDPLVSFVVTILLAALGLGYWSLVIGYAAGTWSAAMVALLVSPYRLALRLDRVTLREYFRFSWPIFVATVSGMVIPQVSMLVGTRKLGLAGAGVITLAGMIGVYTDRIDELVTWTLYPAICRIKDRTELLFEAFVKSNRLALMWGVPFGVGIALFAPALVEFVIGERWRPGVGVLQVFGLIAAANHIGFNWKAFLSARGETRPLAVVGPVVLIAFLVFAVPLLLAFGLDGFAAGMALMTLVSLAVRAYYLRRLFPGFRMLGYAARAIAPTVPAAAVALGLRALTPSHSAAAAIAQLVVYVAVTATATWLFERPLLREVLGYVRGEPGVRMVPA